MNKNMKSMPDSYWREQLTPEQYRVLREAGTDAPFSGTLENNHEDGHYHCAACAKSCLRVIPNLKVVPDGPAFMRQ